ncbi:MAG: acyl-ACP--UDP-N-acetylglucosamine O-acyltransferase [Armatimonadota bacterium]
MNIHPTAIVDPGAKLGTDVVIGPYSVIDGHVEIGDRTVIGSHVRLTGNTSVGNDCSIHTGAALGEPPQDRRYRNEVSYLKIGHRNTIREYVTLHLAVGEGNATIIGDDNLFMACSHVGHNCVIGNNVCVSNYVGLSGGCRIDDRVVIGGMAGVHQYVHVGRLVMIGGYSRITHDIPPFVMTSGQSAKLYGLNTVGLRRAGFSSELRIQLKQAFRMLCYETQLLNEALGVAREALPPLPEIVEFLDFMERSGRAGRHLDPARTRV